MPPSPTSWPTSVSSADGKHRRISLQLADRHDLLLWSRRVWSRCRSFPTLATTCSSPEKREVAGGTPNHRDDGAITAIAKYSIEHRWKFFVGSLRFLVIGVFVFGQLKTAFFPEDVQYWSYIDVWLPNDANLAATNQVTQSG